MIGTFIPWTDRSLTTGYVIDGNGCHLWTGSRTPNGYAKVRVGDRWAVVHRVRYEREVGPIPCAYHLDHHVCDRGHEGCCNPLHCRPTDPFENYIRNGSFSSVNAAKTHCPEGHELPPYTPGVWRRCAICRKAYDRRRRAALKQNLLLSL